MRSLLKNIIAQREFVILAAMLVALAMPMHQKSTALLTAVFALVVMVSVRRIYAKPYISLIPFVLLYGLYGLGLMKNDFALDGHHPAALEQKLSLLVFPALFLLLKPMKSYIRYAIMQMFALGLIAFSVFSFVRGGISAIRLEDWGEIYYSKLAMGFHPTYLAAYACLALAVLLKDQWFSGKPFSPIRLLAGAWILVFICLLSSRAGMLCVLALLVILIFVRSIRSRRADATLLQGVAGLAIVIFLPMMLPGTSERLDEMRHGIERQTDTAQLETSHATTSTQVRFLAWQCSIELMGEHPLGVGTDDVTPMLMEKYQKRGEEFAYRKKLNAHNQYLETGVELGWPGLILLLLAMILGLREAFLRRDILFQSFLFILGFNMLFESFLELQSGILFAGFVWMILLNRSSEEKLV